MSHYWPGEPRTNFGHGWFTKLSLLVAVPGNTENSLEQANWRANPERGARRSAPAFVLDTQDDRRDRLRMRTQGGGILSEPDWSTSAEGLGYDEWTHSRAYVLGLCAGVLRPRAALKYKQEGKKRRLTWGYDSNFEPPFARPLAAHQSHCHCRGPVLKG